MAEQDEDQPPAATPPEPPLEPLPMVALEPEVMVDEFKGSQPPPDNDNRTYIQGVERR